MRDHGVLDGDGLRVSGETQFEKHPRIHVLDNEIQGMIHGPDHLAAALLEGRTVADRGTEVGIAADQQSQTAAGQDLGRVTIQDLPDRPVEEFAVYTPCGGAMSIAAESPFRFLHLSGADSAWDDEGATHTEASVEQEERLERLSAQLGTVKGAIGPGLFVVRVEQFIPDYRALYGDWLAEEPVGRADVLLKVFAMEKLAQIDPDLSEHEYELKRHVHALSLVAVYSYY